jgi:signal transduction histidine kinase
MNLNKLFGRLPIRAKLTIAFALMALLPLSILGVYGIRTTRASLEANAVAQVQHYVELIKADVDHLFAQTRSDLKYLESLGRFAEFARQAAEGYDLTPDSALVEAMALFCASHPVYFQIRYLDLQGNELLRIVDYEGEYRFAESRGGLGSGGRFYRNALAQAPEEIFLTIPVELAHPIHTGRVIAAFSCVQYSLDKQGRHRGLWVVDLYAGRLFELLQKPPQVAGGQLVLSDAQGHYLYHPTKKKEWNQLLVSDAKDNLYSDWPASITSGLLSGREGVITSLPDDIIAFATFWADPSDPKRGYVLHYRIPSELAYAPARQFAWIFTLLGLVAMVVVVGAAYVGASQLTRPLIALSRGAKVIAGGSFDQRIHVATNDELETLASDFNQMAQSMHERDAIISQHEKTLQDYAHNLEEMVESRTAELKDTQRMVAHMDKMAAVGKLAAGVAHEINNPVGIILNRVETLQTESASMDQAALQEDLRVLARQCKRIAAITDDLLRFTRPGSVSRVDIDLREVCEAVVALMRPEYERRGIGLDVRMPDYPVVVLADPDRLEHVVLNIVDNAMDASREGEHVWLTLEPCAGQACFRIRDEGSGIAPDILERIFDPFFTTKPKGEGSGLGLAIAQELITAHGGRIVVSSKPGEGTEFTIEFPLKT